MSIHHVDMTLDELIEQTGTKYHTDIFITKTLGFKPTQTENILRTNYNLAVSRTIDSRFDGDNTDVVTLEDIYANLFPDSDSFISYVKSHPHVLSYIISRKADVSDKRKEVHELGLDEMRTILQAPNTIYNPDYSEQDKELAESQGKSYNVPEFITDYKAQNLKVSVFKHLDAQASKQIIHQQNIEIKIAQVQGSKNPTLLGPSAVLPHQRPRLSARPVSNSNLAGHSSQSQSKSQDYQSPQEILNGIINNEESSDSIIDVTPMKAELMKQPEDDLIAKLEELREQEKVAQHIPVNKSKQAKAKAQDESEGIF